jgi:hypothetical protein
MMSKLRGYTVSGRVQMGPVYRLNGILAPRGCMRDGGRSSGVDMQVKVPNRLKLLWSKVMVVSVEEKAYEGTSGMNQEGER